MKTVVLFTLSLFFILSFSLSGQNCIEKQQECESYYDSTLHKVVYQTVEIFPSYDETGLSNFIELINSSLKQEMITLPLEEVLWNSRVIITFVVNEDGLLENIQIAKKKEEDYSFIDRKAISIVRSISNKKWSPGICNQNKVPTFVSILLNISFQ